MATRSNLERLQQNPADSARLITEDGRIINQASYESANIFASDRLMSVRGLLFFSTPRFTVPSGSEYFVTLTVPADKYIIQYQRNVTVEAAKWSVKSYLGGTVTGGTLDMINNSVVGMPGPDSTISVGTALTGGTEAQNLMIPAGQQNKTSGVSGTGTGIVAIYPPNTQATIGFSHDDAGSLEAQIIFEFAEITADEYSSIQPIFVPGT